MKGARKPRRSVRELIAMYELRDSERLLVERNVTAHQAAMAGDPEYRSMADAPLPDRCYMHAAKMVRTRAWSDATAAAYLSREQHERRMATIARDLRTRVARQVAHGALLPRLDAALTQCVKDALLVGVPSLVIYTFAPGYMPLAYIGAAYVALSIVVAFISRRVG